MAKRSAALIVVMTFVVLQAALFAAGQALVQRNEPASLKAVMESVQRTIHAQKDPARGVGMVAALFPDEQRLRKALRADVDAATVAQVLQFYKQMTPRVEDASRLVAPAQTVVKVWAATTEELAKYAQGTVAWSEFPGGAQKLAGRVLRPGLTFYEVEYLEPGQNSGMTYHLFFWSGDRWCMLGPIWRVVK